MTATTTTTTALTRTRPTTTTADDGEEWDQIPGSGTKDCQGEMSLRLAAIIPRAEWALTEPANESPSPSASAKDSGWDLDSATSAETES